MNVLFLAKLPSDFSVIILIVIWLFSGLSTEKMNLENQNLQHLSHHLVQHWILGQGPA